MKTKKVEEVKLAEVVAPVKKVKKVAPAEKAETKKVFMKNMLAAATDGLTWGQIREALITKYGSAPKKRSSLYQLLDGLPWEKKVGEKRIATYVLKKVEARATVAEVGMAQAVV
jgi:hypothetical protein